MKFYKNVRIKGYDTETYLGNLLVITAMPPDDNIEIESKENTYHYNPDNPLELIEWLFNTGVEYNFFYNIKFDFSVILKPFITTDNKDSIRQGKAKIGNFEIGYITGKSFYIKRLNSRNTERKLRVNFYSIDNFYKLVGASLSLDNVSKFFLGDSKNAEELGIDRKSIGEIKGYYESHKELIDKYCRKDSLLTARLGKLFAERLYTMLKAYPKTLNSSASISKSYLTLYHNTESMSYWNLLSNYENREKAHEYITRSYHGGIFTLYKLGKVENVKEIDLNSAYPTEIINLKSIHNGKITYVNSYKKADYGFYKVKMLYPQDYPFPLRAEKNLIIYPYSDVPVENYITAEEYEFLRDHHIYCDIVDGFIIDTGGEQEFKDYKELYRLKSEYKEKFKETKNIEFQVLSDSYKYVLNASYGCFAESKSGYTEFTNLIYASYITANTRLRIYKAIEELRKHNCEIVAIMTDAIMYRGDWDYPSSNELGDFKIESFEGKKNVTATIYMNGLYMIDGKWKAIRGFPSLYRLKEEFLKASGKEYEIRRTKPMGLKEGIVQHKVNNIGDFLNTVKKIKLESNLLKYEINPNDLYFEKLREKEIKVTIPEWNKSTQVFKVWNTKNFWKWVLVARTKAKRLTAQATGQIVANKTTK